jgi:hypothetical protein
MNQIIVVKNYINEILEFKTIFIWIICKIMLGTLETSTFTKNYNVHTPL